MPLLTLAERRRRGLHKSSSRTTQLVEVTVTANWFSSTRPATEAWREIRTARVGTTRDPSPKHGGNTEEKAWTMSTTSDIAEATQVTSETTAPFARMDAQLIAAAVELQRTAERLGRVGLVIDRHTLSPANRRAAFALQRQRAGSPEAPEPERSPIGFPYPKARTDAVRAA